MDEEQQQRQKRKKLIVIGVIATIVLIIPLSLVIFDLTKNPEMLKDQIDVMRLDAGYDVVCTSGYGMQFCMLHDFQTNLIQYNNEKLVIQTTINRDCLNIYLDNGKQITDMYENQRNDEQCNPSVEFTTDQGWYWTSAPQYDVGNGLEDEYEVVRIAQFWNEWWIGK